MTSLTTLFDAELAKPAPLMFGAVEILLPAYSLRLLDGSGMLAFGGHTFVGRDDTFGVLGALTGYSDGVDDQAPSLTLTLLPPDNSAMAALAAPAAQGSQLSIWVGAVDPVTGLPIPDPDLCFIGELDVATNKVGQNVRSLDISVVSIFDRFFDQDEGNCLNNGFHQLAYPGELGFEFVGLVRDPSPWGSSAPKASFSVGIGAGGGAGGMQYPGIQVA